MIPRITKQELPHRLHNNPNQPAVYATIRDYYSANAVVDRNYAGWAIWIDWRNAL